MNYSTRVLSHRFRETYYPKTNDRHIFLWTYNFSYQKHPLTGHDITAEHEIKVAN